MTFRKKKFKRARPGEGKGPVCFSKETFVAGSRKGPKGGGVGQPFVERGGKRAVGEKTI